jgi:hypothetical protein
MVQPAATSYNELHLAASNPTQLIWPEIIQPNSIVAIPVPQGSSNSWHSCFLQEQSHVKPGSVTIGNCYII